MRRKFVAFVLVISIAMISMMGMSVQAKEAMKITKKTYITTGKKTNTKFHTNKGFAYCITPRRTGPDTGASLNYKNNVNSGGILYLLDRLGTGTPSDYDYLATQLAIWQYDSQYIPDYFVQNPNFDVVKKSKSLASEAAKNRNYAGKQPSISVTPSSNTLSLTSDGQYYKSGAITVNASNIVTSNGGNAGVKYELVNAPSGTKIQTNGTKNYVVVPASSVTTSTSFKFKASAAGNVSSVERYSTGNSSLQELIVLVKTPKTVSQTVTLTITPVKRSCEKVGNTYYDKDGKITDEAGYIASCVHKCVRYNNEYYDENGNVTDQATYELKCKVHKCEVIGNHYFGTDGSEVTADEYNKVCVKHTCEVVGSTYYDKDGNETNYDTYNLQCLKHTCELLDGRYFGRDGFEVTQQEYLNQCVHICEIFENQYYGSKGNIVTESEYKAQCEAQVVPVPNTGNGPYSNLLSIMIGSALLGGLGGTLVHMKKLSI